MSGNHERPNNPNQGQEKNDVSIDAMEDWISMPYNRYELQDGQQSCRENRTKVQDNAKLSVSLLVEVALPGNGAGGSVNGAKDAREVEELEAREAEARKGTCEDEKESEVVAFAETERLVNCTSMTGKDGW